MGIAASKSARLEKALVKAGDAEELAEEHFFGLENFGNTCYANSVIQCLFSVPELRRALLRVSSSGEDEGTESSHSQ